MDAFDMASGNLGVSTNPPQGASRILTSDWTGLNPHLIARFYPVKRLTTGGWAQSRDERMVSQADNFSVQDGFEVHCPITDGTMDMSFNWQSPFEGAGAETKAPTLSAMLQSGAITPVIQAVASKLSIDLQHSAVVSAFQEARGRTGITKLNSTQTFSGMPPISFTLTAHFRALRDPVAEVSDPISQLEEWAVPQFLAAEGLIANGLQFANRQDFIQTVFPSQTPQIIGMRYADMSLLPLVIESVSKPITVPRNIDGFAISSSVQMKLCTLTAWDRRDIRGLYQG